MRIEKIELIGFKSFAEKTTFLLHPGITCIVGPNGAGKSNIVDSFRWVLGEQSAKSLRGEKMEEVIFNGSSTKKPRGMSEVNLILSFDSPEQGNGDSQSLTSVARRLYRSGESEYLINKRQCRLRDIKDLFLDTGLEIKSYSILEQGRIGEILNSKPLERRFLIEEVAGVMKYKVRKTEALSKLESSRLNIQRINDIVVEVKRQINSLDRQAKKAERYKKLSSEMRSIELKIAKKDYSSLRESLEKITADSVILKEKDASVRAAITTIENAVETKRITLLDKEKFLDSLVSELQVLEREMAETERGIAVSTTEQNNLTEYTTRLIQQESDLVQKIEGVRDRIKELDTTERNLEQESESLRQELSEKNEGIRSIERDFTQKEELLESKRKEIFRSAEEISHLRNEVGKLLTTLDNLEKNYLSTLKEAETAKEQLASAEALLGDTEGTLIAKNSELLLLNDTKAKIIADIDEYRSKRDQARSSLSTLREDLASSSSRLHSLQEILHEDLSRETLAEHLRIMASVAEVIDVDEAYEKAIENALSEKINGFIIQSPEEVSAAASVLKEKGLRRTAFIPLEAHSGSRGGAYELPAHMHESVVGRADELVRFHPGYDSFSSVIKGLLDRVVVVRDLSAALSLFTEASMNNKDLAPTIVTMDGETVEPSGAIIVGEGKGILKRKREIRELDSLIEQKKSEMERLALALTEVESALQARQTSLKEIEATVIHAEKEISLLRLTVETQTEEKEKLSRKLAYLTMEGAELLKEKESVKRALAEQETEVGRIDSVKGEAEQLLSRLQDAISSDRERYEEERSSVTELRLSLNSYKERIESLGKEVESSREMLSDLSRNHETVIKEKSDIDARIMQCTEVISKNNEGLRELVLKADRLKTTIAEQRELIRTESEELVHSEQGAKTHRLALDSLTASIGEADVSLAEHRLKIENISDNIRRNYDIEISSFETEPVLPEDGERLSELRTKIQELGSVNLGTLEEYEELKTRYEFLTKQQEDLNKSIAELEEAITKINSTTRRKLREAFEQLNTKFSEVFTMLFGGGKAGLVMTDENNILESGIEIIAQPPGKKLQNITLLSGGEKALTALSLLFASFLIKPSPLCILDEVDAALDESNIERFAKMLRELSSGIQFIVVTHNRVTMEAADYIYGITMEEPGASKVISMQLVDS